MSFNAMKTKYMVVSRTHNVQYPYLVMNNTAIEKVTSYPQLGMHIDENLNWEAHIHQMIQRPNKKMGLYGKLVNTFHVNVLKTYIHSILNPDWNMDVFYMIAEANN